MTKTPATPPFIQRCRYCDAMCTQNPCPQCDQTPATPSDAKELPDRIAEDCVNVCDGIVTMDSDQRRGCKAEIVKAIERAWQPASPVADNPELDATDYAHPAWWRGHDHTTTVFCQKVNEILDGKDGGVGVASEPWESLRRRLLAAERAEVDTDPDQIIAMAGEHWVSEEVKRQLSELQSEVARLTAERDAAIKQLQRANYDSYYDS